MTNGYTTQRKADQGHLEPQQRPSRAAKISVLVRLFPRPEWAAGSAFNQDNGRDAGERDRDEVGAGRPIRPGETAHRISMSAGDRRDVRAHHWRASALPNHSRLLCRMVERSEAQSRTALLLAVRLNTS